MAHVSFLTTEFRTAGNPTSGCNGFPFPFTVAAPGTGNPVAVSFKKCVYWWWKAKIWSLATDFQIVQQDSTVVTCPSGSFAQANATVETDFLNPSIQHINSLSSGGNNLSFNLFQPGNPQIVQQTGLLYPDMALTGNVGTDPAQGVMSFDLVSGPASMTASIDGVSVPLYYDVTTFPPLSFTATSFVMSVVTEWPYN